MDGSEVRERPKVLKWSEVPKGAKVIQWCELSEEEQIALMMRHFGMSEQKARLIHSFRGAAIDGDVITVSDAHAVESRAPDEPSVNCIAEGPLPSDLRAESDRGVPPQAC